MRSTLTAIIPAAAAGRRLAYVGCRGALDVCRGEMLVERQVRLIREVEPQARIVVVVGFDREPLMERLGDTVAWAVNPLHREAGSAHSVGLALDSGAPPRLLICPGDLVFSRASVAALVGGWSAVNVGPAGSISPDKPGITSQDGCVLRFDYAGEARWGQLAYLAGDEAKSFAEEARSPRARNRALHEVLNAVLERGGRLGLSNPRGARLAEVDSSNDLIAVRHWLEGTNAAARPDRRRPDPAASFTG